MHNHNYDIIIIGAGLLGASLACALKSSGLNIAIVDAKTFDSHTPEHKDIRSIALSKISSNILNNIGIWPLLRDDAAAINNIHISDQGHFGFTRLKSRAYDLDAFGYVVAYHKIAKAFWETLNSLPITRFIPALVNDITLDANGAYCVIHHENQTITLKSKLLIAADGSHSAAREKLGFEKVKKNFDQSALVANVGVSSDLHHTAYERFCQSSVIALLPQALHQYGMVWTETKTAIQTLMQMSDTEFLALLQEKFGFRLGHFTWVGKRFTFPVHSFIVPSPVKPHFILLGNASHTVHPVAAQGFNLGLRDAAVLAELLLDKTNQKNLGEITMLQEYCEKRCKDQERIMQFTENLLNIFNHPLKSAALLRNLGLFFLDQISPLKKAFAYRGMGFTEDISALALENWEI